MSEYNEREEQFCINCGEPALKGKIYCRGCYEFGKKKNTNP